MILISKILKFLKRFLRLLYLLANNLDTKINEKINFENDYSLIKKVAAKYDMFNKKDEIYYADQYENFIVSELLSLNKYPKYILHDLACGQGRMIKRMVDNRKINLKSIIGVDFSKDVLEQAVINLGNKQKIVKFVNSEMINYLKNTPDESLELVFILEVLYMIPDPDEVLKLLSRKLQKGGIVFISLRSRYYYALTALKNGLLNSVPDLLTSNRSNLLGSNILLNWESSENLTNIYKSKFGLNIRNLVGIGCCSGIPNDPHDFCNPSELSLEERKILAKLEDYFSKKIPDTGRYILLCASKN